MNIKYHSAIGVAGYLIYNQPLFFVFSVIPDAPLIFNELILLKNKLKFDELLVPEWIVYLYFLTHSVFWVPFIYYYFNLTCAIAFLIHIVTDWFTHEGRFASIPGFPFIMWRVPWGKNILK